MSSSGFPTPFETTLHPRQDDSGFLFSSDIPDVDADESAVASGIVGAPASGSSAQQMESFSASASFKRLACILYTVPL